MKVYIPPLGTVVKKAVASLNGPGIMVPVQLMQYDQQIPVLAVEITWEGRPYLIPEEASANIRMEKPDGKYVLDPALGRDKQGTTVFFSITQQMTAACGNATAAVEIKEGKGILGVGYIPLQIQRNPVPADAVISQNEIPAVEQLLKDTAAAADRASKAAADVEQKLASGALRGQPGERGEPGPPGKDGTVAFEKLTAAQKASLKGEKGEPGMDGRPGKDAQPSVIYRNLSVLPENWNTYTPQGPEETELQTAGYSCRAMVNLPGVDSSMIPYVTLGNVRQTPDVRIAGQAQCCTGGVAIYANEKAALNILTIECRKGVI